MSTRRRRRSPVFAAAEAPAAPAAVAPALIDLTAASTSSTPAVAVTAANATLQSTPHTSIAVGPDPRFLQIVSGFIVRIFGFHEIET